MSRPRSIFKVVLNLMFTYKIDDEIKLALPTLQDAEELYSVVKENIEELKIWMPWAKDEYSLESAKGFINFNLTALAENGSFSTTVLLKDKIVGMIGYHNINKENKSVEIGYWLAKSAQGKGIMTRCCRFYIDYAFKELKLNRVQINCNVENVKSRGIPERLSFEHEGTLRQVEFLNDEYRDWAIYGMLAEDWK